jgi:hypothetical protein
MLNQKTKRTIKRIQMIKRCRRNGEKKVVDKSGKVREGVKIEVKDDDSGKVTRKYLYREKISGLGKEAKEVRNIDISQNRYFQNVEEQDENGDWKQKHHEDESLTEHNKKKQSKKK